jgi:hypothetical protein
MEADGARAHELGDGVAESSRAARRCCERRVSRDATSHCPIFGGQAALRPRAASIANFLHPLRMTHHAPCPRHAPLHLTVSRRRCCSCLTDKLRWGVCERWRCYIYSQPRTLSRTPQGCCSTTTDGRAAYMPHCFLTYLYCLRQYTSEVERLFNAADVLRFGSIFRFPALGRSLFIAQTILRSVRGIRHREVLVMLIDRDPSLLLIA